jgi:hypothetical protein
MPDASNHARTLDDLAIEVRSKNAGPFWVTLDVFLPDDAAYRVADLMITPDVIAGLYPVSPGSLRIFRIPALRVIKVSFPRLQPQGGLHDRDTHAGDLRRLPYPVYAAGLCVAGSSMRLTGIGGPVTVGGLRVEPGDILHGDEHGVLSIPAAALPGITVQGHRAGRTSSHPPPPPCCRVSSVTAL